MNRSYTAFLLAGSGLVPLALGVELPSFGVDSNLVLEFLGLVAVFIAIHQARRGATAGVLSLGLAVGVTC